MQRGRENEGDAHTLTHIETHALHDDDENVCVCVHAGASRHFDSSEHNTTTLKIYSAVNNV